MRDETLRIIEVLWDGPYSVDDVAKMYGTSDRGLIMVYGTHPVFGSDALLFTDGTAAQVQGSDVHETFADRMRRLQPWFETLPSEAAVYVGRLGGTHAPEEGAWEEGIADAFRLNTFFHAPPWNARHVDHHRVSKPTVVLNLGRRHRLSLEVSTLWDQSAWAPGQTSWEPF